jgi:hypothetical protein
MRSFRQITVAGFATAARSIAAFGSGYKNAISGPDIFPLPVAAAEPARLRSAWAAFRRSSRKPVNALLQADQGCKIYDRCALDRSLRQRLQGGGDFNRYPPIAGCASGYRKRQSPVNRALAFFFALDL